MSPQTWASAYLTWTFLGFSVLSVLELWAGHVTTAGVFILAVIASAIGLHFMSSDEFDQS